VCALYGVRFLAVRLSKRIDWTAITSLLLAVSPVVFVWHMELVVKTDEIKDGSLSNGFIEPNPLLVYHFLMYVMFLVCWLSAYLLIRDTDDI
jgi:hypothetical protein